ncbi:MULTISPECIES: PadR family transcriptional regulator [Nocardioides]|uniref:PadR family transcriptional regulator n=1 Tax=Nocardioides TaxID=1839 RepID=UPI000C7890C7|nr:MULTISPECIES: PadR family transcriptional regulator [Nocardioides]
MPAPTWPSDWTRAVLTLCVLRALAPGPTYGYALAGVLEDAGLGAVKGGTLYPLLGRLEAAGWVSVEWRAGEGGPGRKYFSLTPHGVEELRRQSELWDDFTGMVREHLHEHQGAS